MIPCPSCGADNVEGTRFCVKCGSGLPSSPQPEQWRYSGDLGQTQTEQRQQTGGYAPPPPGYPAYNPGQNMMYQHPGGADWQAKGADKKVAAGLCGILLGSLGIHKFILGYSTEGIIMLLITVLTCGIGGMVTGVIGLVEGIIYLTKSDEEFVRTYVQNKKGWF
ncbi:MAG TPA: TM2 domain-containing protein [Pyrinomonadaceae bacterium]|nr:TM2 domain-containing protein [Pyrinomonadaceae bacterium]